MSIQAIGAAIALIAGGFILGLWTAFALYNHTFKVLRANKIDPVIEERNDGMFAIVITMPGQYRDLAEKIVKKARGDR